MKHNPLPPDREAMTIALWDTLERESGLSFEAFATVFPATAQRYRAAVDVVLAMAGSPSQTGEEPLTVLQVACLSVGGAIVTLPRPARHGDVMHLMAFRPGPEAQGFLLSDGSFADREEAYRIARASGQPWLRDPSITSEYLFTEDLW